MPWLVSAAHSGENDHWFNGARERRALTGGWRMRVNVYNEEVTGRVEPTAKLANGVIFKGIRCFLCFKNERSENQKIMHTKEDEDTPAVTFYFTDSTYWKPLLRKTFEEALKLLDDPDRFKEVIAALETNRQD
jgi:hypothetical protein